MPGVGGFDFKSVVRILALLLPSWRFFDEVGHQPSLFYRYSLKVEDISRAEWTEVRYSLPPIQLWSVCFNPQPNLQLHLFSHLTRLMLEVAEHERASRSFSKQENVKFGALEQVSREKNADAVLGDQLELSDVYLKTQRWVVYFHQQISGEKETRSQPEGWFQFKLVVSAPFRKDSSEDYLISSTFAGTCYGS